MPVYMVGRKLIEIEQQVDAVAELLLNRQAMLACAESCTGGWISKVLTDKAGSSAWFERGFITYSNLAKQQMLGVSEQLLMAQGAVSEPVVRAMAQGAIDHSTADYALAVSGIAGPGGGSVAKPVGTVWLAWAGPDSVLSRCELFAGDRQAVRQQTVEMALQDFVQQFDLL